MQIKSISKDLALEMVQKYHDSNNLPAITKHLLGFYEKGEMVGVVTLGFGVRPKETIQKIFKNFPTSNYIEIGRLCTTESAGTSTALTMIATLVDYLKENYPEYQVLYVTAPGMSGDFGKLYQDAGFNYIGDAESEIYVKNDTKVHPRQVAKILQAHYNGIGDHARPTTEQMKELNIQHYRSKNYRYVYFLCGDDLKERLIKSALCSFNLPYPTEDNLSWKVQVSRGQYVQCEKPYFNGDCGKQTGYMIEEEE